MNFPESPWPQAFISRSEPRQEVFDPPMNTGTPVNKPTGGLWTSPVRETADGELTCAWLEWYRDHLEGAGDEHLWILEPEGDPEPDIITIDSHDDLGLFDSYIRDDELAQRYGDVIPLIDFETLADDYDAIYLTEQGQSETRLTRLNLYGWDCETVLWLTWSFAEVEDHGPVSL